MSRGAMEEVVQHLRSAVLSLDGAALTDGQLLERFVSRRESEALEGLVRRHAAMVWGVCRRVLGNLHDAEDAFQVTFLVLVRKAATITPRAKVGNWLYGVAHQTALKARATRGKRRIRERSGMLVPESAAPPPDLAGDWQPLLDQELSRLPEKYRTAIVLCELEGKTLRTAAQQLDCPPGTLASWLARGRSLLAKRLARHGLAVSAGALATEFARSSTEAAPISLVHTTVNAVTLVAAGQAAASVTSADIAALTAGVLKTMLLAKLKVMTAGLLMTAGCLGALGLMYQSQATEPRAGEQRVAAQAPPRQMPAATVLGPKAFRDGDVIEITDVQATSPKLEQGDSLTVRGRVRLASHDVADLALYVTQTEGDGKDETDPAQTTQVKRGQSHFELKATIRHRGYLHVTLYDQSGKPFGGVYFGTAKQMKQIESWSLEYYLDDKPPPEKRKPTRRSKGSGS
jgi:RNA polymerase sigma factor (sigma-70 family)